MINQSNLPSVQRFKLEDFPGAPQWFGQFLTQMNLFTSPVYGILNGGVSYQNIVAPQIYSQTITAATPTAFSFTNPLNITPRAVVLGNVYSSSPSTHPSVSCQVMWFESRGKIFVQDVVGLTAGTKYTVVLVIF